MAYSLYRPDIGYVQGLSFIAALVIVTTEDELSAFALIANLLSRESMINDFYQFDMGEVKTTFKTFLNLLS